MQIRSGIRWPVGVDFNSISTPGRKNVGNKGKIMLLTRKGCTNRPFYHIEVTRENYPRKYVKGIPPIEQVGTFDPLPNEHGEKLCSLNLERIAFWVGKGIKLSEDVSTLLGLAGFLPQSPHAYKTAWKIEKKFCTKKNKLLLNQKLNDFIINEV